MAEEGSVYELEGLKKQLESLFSRYSSDELRADSKPFCSEFCQLVEKYASRWQVPLPQLRILEIALCYFARASIFFTPNCDHVLHTLSSLALSVFELLLFFDQKDFHQEPLKQFTVTFQECHLALARHQNVPLLQVERLVQGGGLWAGPALQSILSESSLPQSEVDGCISSELPVFFELRVRYLLSCERVSEAMALAKCCACHSIAGQHLFFLQVYLTWLFKTSQHDRLHKEVAEFNGKDAIHLICSLECEEKDELLLDLSRAFLSEQLRRGDMYYLCDLVFIWTKLHSRLNTSKQALLEEVNQLILSATNVNSIFPFIRAILQELGEDGVQFCVELCANALGSCLPCDVITKSLIYKTIAGLLPNDLEVSRACALLVFFLERTVEAYKMVYLLYMHPDQEYHVERSPIRNHVRFETLQIMKKDLYFDPEFWNLIALRTNCLKLMSGKVVSGALEEIMEDKWILSYCAKEPTSRPRSSVCQKGSKGAVAKKRHHKDDRHHKEGADTASKRLKGSPGKTRLNVDYTLRKKGNQGSSSEPLRRSFWQLERLQDNVAGVGRGELRRATRLSEKNPPKRRIRKPKWLLEDSGNPGKKNLQKIKKHGSKHHVVKRSENIELKNSANPSHLMVRENSRHQKGFSLESVKPATFPQVILELSLPDNELGTFTEDACNRQRGFPQVLFYRPTVKLPATSQPAKTVHRKEVILRARDAAMFAQQLHCYARRQKGKGKGPNIQGSVSTITRSSVQGSPPKDPQRDFCEKSDAEMKGGITSQTPAAAEVTKSPVFEKVLEAQATKAVSRKTFSGRELCEKSAEITEAPILDKVLQAQTIASARELCDESAVEMKVTIASTAATVTPGMEKASKAVKDASKTTTLAEVLQTSPVDNNQMEVTDKIPPVSNDPTTSQCRDVLRDGRQGLKSISSQAETGKNVIAQAKGDTSAALTAFGNISEVNVTAVPCAHDTSGGTMVTTCTPTDQGSINDISALTLVTEMVTELSPEALTRDLENHKQPAQTESSYTPGSKSLLADVQGEEEATQDSGSENSDLPESDESKLEFCCTFCNKVFKGSRVVAHAMFHYRKDECMFCRTMFKDDLLAMMHLSDHIEKLKRSKELAGNNDQETKEVSTRKTSAAAKTTNVSSVRRSSGRPRKSPDGPTSASLPHSTPSGSRRLRSNGKAAEAQSLHEKKHDSSKHLNNTIPVHKVNGHIGKNKGHDGPEKETVTSEAKQPLAQQEISQGRTEDRTEDSSLQKNQDLAMDSSATSEQVDEEFNRSQKTESMQILKMASKQSDTVVEERNAEPQERVCCPADGCGWFTDLSKNRVALLYHVLEDHYGEVKPLELAFRVGNSKCSCCMRVMWSFEHFQHHVERHRLTPRHPCLHQGCAARFKTGIETRRHTRRHNPLQAVCCHPGCSQLFICLWALNLHEREHYGSKLTKSDKNTSEQTSDKQSQEEENTTAVNKTESVKAACKSREEAADISSTGKHAQASLPATVGASEESKERNRTKDSHVLKNLSNKDTSTPPTGPILRLRQTLRKVTNTQSLVRQDIKARYKFKKKQVKRNTKGPKRRGRPPKPKEPVHDENTTTGQNNQTIVEKNAPLQSLPKAAEASNVSNESNEGETIQQVRDVVKTKSFSKQLKKNHLKHKGVSHNSSTAIVTAHSLADKTHKLTAKNVHRVKKRAAPKESGGQTASSDSSKSKKHKVANGEANAKKEKSCPLEEREEKAKVENSGSTPSGSGNSVPAVPASSLDVGTAPSITSGERKQKLPAAGKAKKSLVKKEAKREKRPHAASSDSGKTNKKHKDFNRKEDKKKLKDKKKATLKSVDPQVEAKASDSSPDVEGKAKDATTDATLDSSGSPVPAATAGGLNEKTSPPTATEENMQKSKKSHVTKKSDPSKANKKRKSVHTEGDTKIVKKKCKDQGVKSPSETKSKTEVRPLAEGKAEVADEEGKTSSLGYTVITNGQAAREEAKTPVLKDVLAGYSSKPYMRPPPTAYLDEKYITMPKRRKQQQQQQQPSSPRSPPPQHNHVTKALQRRRCANCFATFNSADDLQSHLQLQKCSDLFGFDSDDEGNSLT